ncbi:MAG: MarR family transcriptional regulator [Propionibacteriaceae bacterium]|nr:MarR family transcriptional regulator [Propionibacteriaceae bacterium]
MSDVVGIKQRLLLDRVGDDPAARLILALHTTARRIDAACAALLAGHQLSEGRLAALLAVVDEPGISPRTVADRLEVTTATVTGLLDGLERAGLVERRPHETDRRARVLVPTVEGEQLVATLTPIYADWLRHLTDGVSRREREATEQVLATLQSNLREHR